MISPELLELSQTVREVLAEHGPLTTAGVGVYLQDRQPEDLAAACIRTGRHYLGWEQDSGYYEQMQERLKTETYRKMMSISEGPCDRPPRAVLPLGSRLLRTTMQAAQLCFSDGL